MPARGSMSADAPRPRMSFDSAALEAADLRSMTRSDSNRHMAIIARADREPQDRLLCLNVKAVCVASDKPTIANPPHLNYRCRAHPRSTSTSRRSLCLLPYPQVLRRPLCPSARTSADSPPSLCTPSPSHTNPRRRYTTAR
jgi:hypothetical protein